MLPATRSKVRWSPFCPLADVISNQDLTTGLQLGASNPVWRTERFLEAPSRHDVASDHIMRIVSSLLLWHTGRPMSIQPTGLLDSYAQWSSLLGASSLGPQERDDSGAFQGLGSPIWVLFSWWRLVAAFALPLKHESRLEHRTQIFRSAAQNWKETQMSHRKHLSLEKNRVIVLWPWRLVSQL